MEHLVIEDLLGEEKMDQLAMESVTGGRFKHPFQHVSVDQLLTTPDGDPVDVYVDGVKANSVITGYYHL